METWLLSINIINKIRKLEIDLYTGMLLNNRTYAAGYFNEGYYRWGL